VLKNEDLMGSPSPIMVPPKRNLPKSPASSRRGFFFCLGNEGHGDTGILNLTDFIL